MIALWLTASALAGDPIVDALGAELARTEKLRLTDARSPYFAAYDLYDSSSVHIEAVLGGLVTDTREPDRTLGIAVRVGSPTMDNTNFTQRRQGDGIRSTRLCIDDDPAAVRQAAWLGSDAAYKDAVENLARKQAARRNQVERPRPDDFAPGAANVAALPPGPAVEGDALADIARSLSAMFLEHPAIESSRVVVGAEWGRRVLLDSGGTRVEKPLSEVSVRVIASVRSADGEEIWDHASWTVRTIDQLPTLDAMDAGVDALVARLATWRAAPKEEDEYVGPVLFSGEAAIEVVRQLLVPALVATPPEEVAKDSGGMSETRVGGMRLKRRVLPTGFDVSDDPTADPTLASSYAYDDEGVPAEPVALVEDGIVRGLLASRTPSEDVATSNGHGRGSPGTLIRGGASWLQLAAQRPLSEAKLIKAGLKIAPTYDQDYVLVVRRLADTSVGPNDFAAMFGASKDARTDLSAPVDVVRRYADGREEPARGWRFQGIDRRTLRDIVGAGPSETETLLVSGSRGVLTGRPTTFTAPALLFDELELVPIQSVAQKAPRVPSPLAAR